MNILLIGNFDPAGLMISLKGALNAIPGCSCRSMVLSPSFYNYPKDIVIDEVRDDFELTRYLLEKADLLCFVHSDWDSTFPFGPIKWRDYLPGKKVVVMIVSSTFNHNPRLSVEKYRQMGVTAISTCARFLTPFQGRGCKLIPIPMRDILKDPKYKEIFVKYNKCSDKVRVLHAPTDELGKNTQLFIQVMKKLQRRYANVEMVLMRGKSHREAVEATWNSDIVFGDIYIEGYWGRSVWEALMLSKPALAYLDQLCKEGWRSLGVPELPVVEVNPNNLGEKIAELIEDASLREEIGVKGRRWFEQYYDERKLAENMINYFQELPKMGSKRELGGRIRNVRLSDTGGSFG